MSILSQIKALHKQGKTPAQIADELGDADPKWVARQIKNIDTPKKRKPRRRSRPSGKTTKTFRASQVLSSGAEIQTRRRAGAMAEQVSRVNEQESTNLDGVQPDPQGGYTVLVNGEEVSLTDDPDSAWQAYHAYYNDPLSIPWTVGGQTVWLEV